MTSPTFTAEDHEAALRADHDFAVGVVLVLAAAVAGWCASVATAAWLLNRRLRWNRR